MEVGLDTRREDLIDHITAENQTLLYVRGNSEAEVSGENRTQRDIFNTAVYMKRIFTQQDIAFMTAVGQDIISQRMVSACNSEKLNNQHIFAESDRNPGIYLVQTDDQGERSFLYWRDSYAAK